MVFSLFYMKLLITGGAGFVGSYLALAFKKQNPDNKVTVLDNLKRRGSELNLPQLKKAEVSFQHGDIRDPSDLQALEGNFDILIEASSEPSVLAGLDGNPSYLIDSNLNGTVNCLNFARQRVDRTIFLSTSRVYSLAPLKALKLSENESRFSLEAQQAESGATTHGIDESFPTHLPRSLYGATKLCSEYLIQEYGHTYGTKAVIDRCGVIAGPGQFGKTDQGVFTLWVANHYFGKPLKYTGFGGKGKQVRDLLHPADLFDLIKMQIDGSMNSQTETFNVGGGLSNSVSLYELTNLCREVTGKEVPLEGDSATSEVDIPYYVTNSHKIQKALGWKPKKTVDDIVREIAFWLKSEEPALRALFT